MIRHIIAMPPDVAEGRESYFQGFSLALFPDYLGIFNALIAFPHDALDPFLDGDRFVQAKMAGSGLDIYMLRADLLGGERLDFDRSLNVIWSTGGSAELVEAALERFNVRPVHITVGQREGAVSLTDLTAELAGRLVIDLVRRAAVVDTALAPIAAAAEERPLAVRDAGPIGFPPRLHNCTAPLVDLLQVYGLQISGGRPIEPSDSVDEHVQGIVELVRVVDAIRHGTGELPEMRKNDALLFCPSSYTYLYRADSHHWNVLYRTLTRERRNFLKQSLIRNRGYANFTVQVVDGGAFNPYEDEVLGPLLVMRQYELRVLTLMIAIVAANQFIPAVRFPNAVMLHHDRLSNIYALVNSHQRDRLLELNRRVADYSRTICEEIGPSLMDAAFGQREKLLAVCDFPIEWISVELLPAMFRYEMSRVPSTPGNVMGHALLSGQRVMMPLSAVADVLIVRSLSATDPIHDHLMFAVDHYAESSGLGNLTIQLVDVSSEEELVEALNAFNGMTLIFDCHGNHGGEESHAWLHIGADRVDVWQLANRARIPPIVILAACSTHALNGSHASVANGLLRCGAISVLGTFAPVDAIHTGMMIGRLLYRMSAFIGLQTNRGPRSWRDIVSGFFRMSYATDVLRDLENMLAKISAAQSRALSMDANLWINSKDPAWFDKLFGGIMTAAGLDREALATLFRQRYQFVETMLFVQLGRPENILIFNDGQSAADDEADDAQAAVAVAAPAQ